MPSFDVVSELQLFEVKHAVQNTEKEIATRFDFKGSDISRTQWERQKNHPHRRQWVADGKRVCHAWEKHDKTWGGFAVARPTG